MPRRAGRRRGSSKQRQSRRGAAGFSMPVFPVLPSPGVVAGVLGRWLARPSRLGLSRALLGIIILTVLVWVIVGLSLAGS